MSMDEDVTHAYDQINDLSEELEDLEADLYEDDDTDDDDEEPKRTPRMLRTAATMTTTPMWQGSPTMRSPARPAATRFM